MTGNGHDTASRLLEKVSRFHTRQEQRFLVANVDREHWRSHENPLIELTERMLNDGFNRDALDVLMKSDDAGHRRIQQLRAWALRASGAPHAASQLLADLRERGAADPETLGFSGSVEKDLAQLSTTSEEAEVHWRRSLEFYLAAFEQFGDYWHGINAATLSARCGLTRQSRAIAIRVADLCDADIANNAGNYYALATLGQAALITGDDDKARWAYLQAGAIENVGVGRLGREKRQAEDLLEVLNRNVAELDDVFPTARVAVFAGNRIDTTVRTRGFSRKNVPAIRAAITRQLEERDLKVGYAAAADGADILFLEAMSNVGGQTHIVLPTDVMSFRKMSVDPEWAEQFDQLIEHADSLTVTGDLIDPADKANFDYCNQVTLGMAELKARELGTRVAGLAVWDGQRGSVGGTADSIGLWEANAVPVTILAPHDGSVLLTEPPHRQTPIGLRRIMAMVKADVVGYSQLSENEVANYFQQVLPQVASLCGEFDPVVQDTFGDAFYFVFESVERACRFAFALQSLFRATHLTIRIATHAGPLLECYDPVRGAVNYTGRHASRVSRVEPVADENQILATQQIAALIAVQCPQHFELVYTGERILPKGFGSERLYVLTPRPTISAK
jgi:class 3 adenylate cyclase